MRARRVCAQGSYRRNQKAKLLEMFGRGDGVPEPPYAYGPDELCPRCGLQSLEDQSFEPDPFFCEVCGEGRWTDEGSSDDSETGDEPRPPLKSFDSTLGYPGEGHAQLDEAAHANLLDVLHTLLALLL